MTVVRLWVLFLVAVFSGHVRPRLRRTTTRRGRSPSSCRSLPGGSVDFIGRLVGQKLSERLGRPVIVENRPGAGSATGALAVSKSAPDGYTLLLAPSGTFSINPTLYKQLSYDPAKDLTPVDSWFAIHCCWWSIRRCRSKRSRIWSSSPRRSRVSSRSHLRARGRRCISWASCSNHGRHRHRARAISRRRAGHPGPHRRPSPDDVRRSGDGCAAGPGRQGARARGVVGDAAAAAPDIPTVAEAGLPGIRDGVVAVDRGSGRDTEWHRHEAQRRAQSGHGRARRSERLIDRGQIPVVSASPPELVAFVATETGRWGKIVREAGIAGSL